MAVRRWFISLACAAVLALVPAKTLAQGQGDIDGETNPDTDGDGQRGGAEDYNGNGIPDATDQDTCPVPRPLTPRPEEAFYDQPESYSSGCHTTADPAVIRPCTYGQRKAKTRVAILASLTEKVCPCEPYPVVSESTLTWRNEGHLTATFAQQLRPAMRDIVAGALATDDAAIEVTA